uniref:Uncharacterized protein n=1 Tax=Trichogramma kaykai TaxID=54128 RepID=A0ABD2XPX1_9HYME
MKWRCYLQLAYCSRNKLGVFLRSTASRENSRRSRFFSTRCTRESYGASSAALARLQQQQQWLDRRNSLRQMSVTARRHGAAALQGWRLRGLPGPRGIHQRAAGGIRGLSNQFLSLESPSGNIISSRINVSP